MIDRYDIKEISSIFTLDNRYKYFLKIELAALEITLPREFPIEAGEVEYECLSKSPIPPGYIEFLSRQ